MGALNGSTSDVQRRTNNFIHTERFCGHSGTNNIHHGIHRADFVEMDFIDISVMNFCFCFS